MNKIERIKLLKAMEFICRNLNDEEIFYWTWLQLGVADGDIKYGDLSIQSDDLEELEYYLDNETFADMIDTFLCCMAESRQSGGLYCDGVCAGEREENDDR